MRGAALLIAAGILFLSCCSGPGDLPSNAVETDPTPDVSKGKMWVTAERVDRHTCPSKSCGIVGTLDFREAAKVEEQRGDWVRISRSYDASCVNGRSEYVDKGPASCTPENGVNDGKFAEWVEGKHLASKRPPDPAETAAVEEQLIKDSDDFTRYRRSFAKAARTLIDRGECTSADLQANGGFVKSVNNRDAPVYFTYCGGFTRANRIYLNARTGEIYR